MNETKIAWADYSWNPVTGCTPISEGCEHCYCRVMEKRFGWPTAVTLHPERLDDPLRQGKPGERVFVCSMSDLWHDIVPWYFVNEVIEIAVRAHAERGTVFQFLTKRADRLYEWSLTWPKKALDGVWLGVTAENQARANERIPMLLQVPAAVHFVSVEPMLGAVVLPFDNISNLPDLPGDWCPPPRIGRWYRINDFGQELGWVIAGCESGPGRRPAQQDWFRDLKNQCVASGVPFFYKQGGVDGKVTETPELDGRQWKEFPPCAGS